MLGRPALGYQNYEEVITENIFYIDKTEFIKEWWEYGDKVTLITRPRRFGKTLNMEKCFGKKAIILLDEYDTPMQEAWLAGNWNEAVEFFRNFFNATFKTNDHIHRGIITGITRISKESIFSDLNNLEVVTTTSKKYATSFVFM